MNVTCGSCSNAFVSTDNVYMTRCGHIFHMDCLFNWLVNTNTCPECTGMCTTSDVHRLYLTLVSESPSDEEAIGNLDGDITRATNTNAELDIVISDLTQQTNNALQDQKNLQVDITNLNAEYSREMLPRINGLKEQIKKSQVAQKKLNELQSWECIQKVLSSSTKDKDIEEILNGVSPKCLSRMIVLLGREIKNAEEQREASRMQWRDVQQNKKKLISETSKLLAELDVQESKTYKIWENNVLKSQISRNVEHSQNREAMMENQPSSGNTQQ